MAIYSKGDLVYARSSNGRSHLYLLLTGSISDDNNIYFKAINFTTLPHKLKKSLSIPVQFMAGLGFKSPHSSQLRLDIERVYIKSIDKRHQSIYVCCQELFEYVCNATLNCNVSDALKSFFYDCHTNKLEYNELKDIKITDCGCDNMF